jgi:hypothetical protein
MDKWSVALFGHDKPNYTMIETCLDTAVASFVDAPPYHDMLPSTGFSGWLDGTVEFPDHVYHLHSRTGNEKRTVPGSIVGFKPFENAYWSPAERRRFLIVGIEGLSRRQMEALCEPEYDLNSYREYNIMNIDQWFNRSWFKTLTKPNMEKAQLILTEQKDELYQEYCELYQLRCGFPTVHWRKRRFRIFESELWNMGVDLSLMKNTSKEYVPNIIVPVNKCYDKLRERYLSPYDNLNQIRQKTANELEARKTAEEILTEIRNQ